MTTDQQFILALVGAAVTVVTAMLATYREVVKLKEHVNSRMDELVALTRRQALAEGRLQAHDELRRPDRPAS